MLTTLLEYLDLLTHVAESGLAPECYVQITLEPGIFHHASPSYTIGASKNNYHLIFGSYYLKDSAAFLMA